MMYGKLCTEFYNADKQFANENELSLYKELFSTDDQLLEPMCGSGRLLIPLLQAGFNIDGFDNSEYMLESCKKRADELKLEPSLFKNKIDSFSPRKKYQGIVIPLGSFQLLYPREKAYNALVKFHQWLALDGKLVMDLFVPWEVLYEHGDVDTNTREVTLPYGDLIKINNHTTTNKFEQHMLSKTHYSKFSGNTLIQEEQEQMNILWYYQYEMELLLEKYGFTYIKQVKRFLNGSDHMTFIAKKKSTR